MDLSSGRVYKNTEKWWNGLKSWWSNFRRPKEKAINTLKNKKKQLVETEKI